MSRKALSTFSLSGNTINKLPDITIETAKLFLHGKKRLCVLNGCGDLQAIANYTRVRKQPLPLALVVSSHPGRIESAEGSAGTLPLVQDYFPPQPRMGAFENQKLKKPAIVVDGHAPFVVMICDHQISPGPVATLQHGAILTGTA